MGRDVNKRPEQWTIVADPPGCTGDQCQLVVAGEREGGGSFDVTLEPVGGGWEGAIDDGWRCSNAAGERIEIASVGRTAYGVRRGVGSTRFRPRMPTRATRQRLARRNASQIRSLLFRQVELRLGVQRLNDLPRHNSAELSEPGGQSIIDHADIAGTLANRTRLHRSERLRRKVGRGRPRCSGQFTRRLAIAAGR